MDANVRMMLVINALIADQYTYRTQDVCLDCGGKQLNYTRNSDREFGTPMVVHNCEGTGCCSCHNEMGGAGYYGGSQEDSEEMETLALAWAKVRGVVL